MKQKIEGGTTPKCGFMLLTPHYDSGHNGGMWCAEDYPCRLHGEWRKYQTKPITTSASTTPIQETWQEKIRTLWIKGDKIKSRKLMWETVLNEAIEIAKSELQRKERETIKKCLEVRPEIKRPNEFAVDLELEIAMRSSRNQTLQEWTDSITKLK